LRESLENTKKFIIRVKAEFPLLDLSCDFFYIDDKTLSDIISRPLVEKFLCFAQPLDIAKSDCSQGTHFLAHSRSPIYGWLEKTLELYNPKQKLKQESFYPLHTYRIARMHNISRCVTFCYLVPHWIFSKVEESWYYFRKMLSTLMGGIVTPPFAFFKLSNLCTQSAQSAIPLERVHSQLTVFDVAVANAHKSVTLLADSCLDYEFSTVPKSEQRMLENNEMSVFKDLLNTIKVDELEKAIEKSRELQSEVKMLMSTIDTVKTKARYLRFEPEEIKQVNPVFD
jgi:hypothetical protein